MSKSGNRIASAAAAVALVSFSAPALAQTVEIVCDVERHMETNGLPSDNRFVSQWRLSVDTGTPDVTLTGIEGNATVRPVKPG